MIVNITPEAKLMLDMYVELADGEISGLGKASVDGEEIYIEEIYLLKQKSSVAETELDTDAVAEFLTDLIVRKEDPGLIKVWWHSHSNMGVFWSGEDQKTASKFGNGWMVSLVLNKKKEYKCRLDVYDPVHLIVDDAKLAVSYPMGNKELKERVKKEIKDKVTSSTAGFKPNCVPHFPQYHQYHGGQPHNGVGFCGNNLPPWAEEDGWERGSDGVWRRDFRKLGKKNDKKDEKKGGKDSKEAAEEVYMENTLDMRGGYDY